MASGGADIDKVKQTLSSYKDRSETTESLKLTNFIKCIEACGLGQHKTTIEASVWAVLQGKDKKISIDKISTEVIDLIAADVVGKKRKLKTKAPVDDPEVQTLATDIRSKIAAKAGVKAKAATVDATTARLTNVAGYTGAHKQRFGEDGKGKGLEGRADVVENTGYVGNYKGSGTFDKKH
jgi:hypothetical protein